MSQSICEEYKIGTCTHGLGGIKLHNGVKCSYGHPKRCREFTKLGTHSRLGCDKGDECERYHPKHCSSSVRGKQCFDHACTLVHLAGTKRYKPKSTNESNRNRTASKSEPRNRPDPGKNNSRPNTSYQDPSSNSGNDFLELQDLLLSMRSNFQSKIQDLKAKVAMQDSKWFQMGQVFKYLLPTSKASIHNVKFLNPTWGIVCFKLLTPCNRCKTPNNIHPKAILW